MSCSFLKDAFSHFCEKYIYGNPNAGGTWYEEAAIIVIMLACAFVVCFIGCKITEHRANSYYHKMMEDEIKEEEENHED